MQQTLRDILPVFARNYENSPKWAQKSTHRQLAKMLRTAGSIPVGTANGKRKNRPKKSVFCCFFADFTPKIGMKNSYAPRAPLVNISQQTRYRGSCTLQ